MIGVVLSSFFDPVLFWMSSLITVHSTIVLLDSVHVLCRLLLSEYIDLHGFVLTVALCLYHSSTSIPIFHMLYSLWLIIWFVSHHRGQWRLSSSIRWRDTRSRQLSAKYSPILLWHFCNFYHHISRNHRCLCAVFPPRILEYLLCTSRDQFLPKSHCCRTNFSQNSNPNQIKMEIYF